MMTITANPFTATISPNEILVHHARAGHLDITAMMLTMPTWAPAIIRAAAEQIADLQKRIEAPTPAGAIQPMSTAPLDGTRVDIWVTSNTEKQTPRRVPDAAYSHYLSQPFRPYTNESFSGWCSHGQGTYLDKDDQVIGWSPILKWN